MSEDDEDHHHHHQWRIRKWKRPGLERVSSTYRDPNELGSSSRPAQGACELGLELNTAGEKKRADSEEARWARSGDGNSIWGRLCGAGQPWVMDERSRRSLNAVLERSREASLKVCGAVS